jgi:hypothetical protein
MEVAAAVFFRAAAGRVLAIRLIANPTKKKQIATRKSLDRY